MSTTKESPNKQFILEKDNTYQKEYDVFVKGFSYAKVGVAPNYQIAIDALKALVSVVVS